MQTAAIEAHEQTIKCRIDEISALDAAKQLEIDLNRLYVLLRLGRIIGRKVDGEWRVCRQSVADRLRTIAEARG